MIEAMKQMVESLSELVPDPQIDFGPAYEGAKKRQQKAIAAGRKAIAEAEKHEPVAWMDVQQPWDLYKNKPQVDVVPLYTSPPQRQPLEGVIDVQPIGYHSLQLIFESQDAIKKFKAAHGIKENT